MLLSQGLVLMLVGFGTVFLFLVLLWGVLIMGGKIISRVFKTDSADQTSEDDSAVAAAIAVAIKAKRDLVFSSECK